MKYKLWTKEKCQDEAKKYETRKAFAIGSQNAYRAAARNKWLDQICAHMDYNKIKDMRNKRDKAIILVGYCLALRVSEIVNLRIENIERNEDGLKAVVYGSKTDKKNEGQIKVSPSNHDLFFCPGHALQEWLNVLGESEGRVFRSILPDGTIGESITTRNIYAMLNGLCRQAGLDPSKYSPHSLRSGFVTAAAQNGANIFKIQEVTGHKDLNVLRGYYRNAELFRDHAGEGLL